MDLQNEIFIDIGPHKTGSTFRQRIIYPHLKDINFLGERNILYLFFFNDFEKYSKIIISNENLSGYSYLPDHDALSERKDALNNLKRMFPNAKIITCTRKRESWIKSLYKQYVWAGGVDTFERWMNRMDDQVFDLDPYIESLKNNFSDVLVLSFEDLKKDHRKYSRQLCDYIGSEIPTYENKKVNVSLSERQLNIYRIFNRVWKTHENPIGIPLFRHWRTLLYTITSKDKSN
jgi:hypothetical protein